MRPNTDGSTLYNSLVLELDTELPTVYEDTTTTTTSLLAKSAVTPSLPTEHEEQDTDGLRDTIAARAYALYHERGYRQGCDLQDWLDAEREILSRQPAV